MENREITEEKMAEDKIDSGMAVTTEDNNAQIEEVTDVSPTTVSSETVEESSEQSNVIAEAETTKGGLSDADVAQLLIDISEAQERAAKLADEKKLIYEQLMRRQAEFENYRKRMDRERGEIAARAKADIVTELLPVLDNLERALGSSLNAGEGVGESILTGVKLIHRQFVDLLANMGLSVVKAVGQPFDPNLHEAVTTEATNDLPENTVVEELQRGYMLGDKLLRPAMVKVAVRG